MTTPTPLPVPFMELNKEFVPVVYESWEAQMRAYGLAEYQRGLKDAIAAHEAQPSIMEHKIISVQRFRDPEGSPTCCANHESGEICRFLGSRKFGIVDVCMLGEQRDLAPRTGFQRPDARCEVWAET